MANKFKLVAVDPGVGYYGLCAWDGVRIHSRAEIGLLPVGAEELVIEIPQVYQGAAQKGDQNDLIRLAFHAGMLSEILRPNVLTTVLPREWKGTLPKASMTQLIKNRVEELFPNSAPKNMTSHDVDACGMILWKLGLLKKRIVPR